MKPFSQSYGIGLAAGVMTDGWLGDAGLATANETTAGEGGAKRGEYEVSIRGKFVHHVNPSFTIDVSCQCESTNDSSARGCL